MAKVAIYLLNNSLEKITANSIIPLGDVVRRYGQNIHKDGNSVTLCDKCSGYYKVDIVATLDFSKGDFTKIILEKDGVPVVGANAQIVPSSDGTSIQLPISVIVKNSCGGSSNLSLRLLGTDTTVANLTTVIERL